VFLFHPFSLSVLCTMFQDINSKKYQPYYVLQYSTGCNKLNFSVSDSFLCSCKMSGYTMWTVLSFPGGFLNYTMSTGSASKQMQTSDWLLYDKNWHVL
jgi:hypothetical protein